MTSDMPVIRISLGDGIVVVEAAEPGVIHGSYPQLADSPLVCISASEVSDEADLTANSERHEQLEATLRDRGLTYWQAAVGDPQWKSACEALALAEGDLNFCKELASKMRQEAFLVWTPDALRLVPVGEGEPVLYGWRTVDSAKATGLSEAASMLGVRSEFVGPKALREAMQNASSEIGPERAFDAYRALAWACPVIPGRIPPRDDEGRNRVEDAKQRRVAEQEQQAEKNRLELQVQEKQRQRELEHQQAEERAEKQRALKKAQDKLERREAKARIRAALKRLSKQGAAWISDLKPETLMMVSRYCADGNSHEWVLEASDKAVLLKHRSWSGKRQREAEPSVTTHHSIAEAVRSSEPLQTVPGDSSTIIEVFQASGLTEYEIGDLFLFPLALGDQVDGTAGAWTEGPRAVAEDPEALPCTINGYDVLDAGNGAYLLFDGDAEDFHPGRLIVEYLWASESPGIVWQGGFSLSQAGRFLLTASHGDSSGDSAPMMIPCASPEEILGAVIDFVFAHDLVVAAGIALYPGTLSKKLERLVEETLEWSSLSLGLSENDARALYDALMGTELFAQTQEALSKPKSELGKRFKAALRADRGNIPSTVLAGQWATVASTT